MISMKNLLLSIVAFGAIFSANGQLRLASLFGDNMVIQQQCDAAIWGEASPRAVVEITASWSDKPIRTKADKGGEWRTTIPTPVAGGAYTIAVSSGEQRITLDNVLVGEVWLCSGQSNMFMKMRIANNRVTNASVDRPIRVCSVPRVSSLTPQDECDLVWAQNDQKRVDETSAVAYFFADYLQSVLDVPVGIIVSAWGGTPIEAWMDQAALRKFGDQVSLAHLDSAVGESEVEVSQLWGTVLYNAMIEPLVPYTIKGWLWYQGESNAHEPELYEYLLPAYAQMMRQKWGDKKMPLYYVQIAPFDYNTTPLEVAVADRESEGAQIREAQSAALRVIPYSGMVSTLDLGLEKNIHPRNKREVGVRLAHHALVNDYSIVLIEPRSPRYKSHRVEGDRVFVTFETWRSTIADVDGDILGFELAGADQRFYAASARLVDGCVVELSCGDVPQPHAVRYAYSNFTTANLHNSDGIPVDQFRSDDWAVK
ncbi:MAG: sialate O-acetylesterase [Rikenellaceae bacterium]